MQIQGKEEELLRTLCDEWNMAEKAIKIAEKASIEYGNPSILELRYAGRKIVEFLQLTFESNPTGMGEAKLQDAICDCHRARHDATDHATTEIVLRLEAALKKFKHREVREAFPKYSELRAELGNIREMITDSREDRNSRHDFYCEIEKDHLPKIMKLYEEFLVAEIELRDDYVWRRLKDIGLSIGWAIAILLAILNIVT